MTNEKRLIDANEIHSVLEDIRESYLEDDTMSGNFAAEVIKMAQDILAKSNTVDAVILPCSVGDTVYGRFGHYGKKIHECKVVKSKVCQFRDRTLRYFLDVEFSIIDPYYRDGRLMRCMQQAVFGEDFGSWDRVFRTFEEAAIALAKMDGDGNA